MGLVVTAQAMIDQARSVTKTETLDQANAFCTNAELLLVLNTELSELDDTILQNEDEAYRSATYPFALVGGTSLYALPAAVYKVRSVDVLWTTDIRGSARRFNEAAHNRLRSMPTAWAPYAPVYYRVDGANLEILPVPASAVNVVVNYTPSFVPLTAYSGAGGTYESQNGWHLAAVWGLAAYIALADKDTDMADRFAAMKAAQLKRVASLASSRITGEPQYVQETRTRDEEGFF